MDWLYEKTEDNTSRFVLGTIGKKPLVCFGINPSTATPEALDQTITIVQNQAYRNGYDSYIMLNVYPQRATKPAELHRAFVLDLKSANEKHIATIINNRELTIWAAWGAVINQRKYLLPLLCDIIALPELQNCHWVSRGAATKKGHPHHPLYVKSECPFDEFNALEYMLLRSSL